MAQFIMVCDGIVEQNSVAHQMDNWTCTEETTGSNKNWTRVELDPPLIEDLSIADAEAITVAALTIWAIAWGARQVFNHIIEPHRR